MKLDRTKTYTLAGCEWAWRPALGKWCGIGSCQWLSEDLFILLNPVPVVEMETITKTITATFDENGGCSAQSSGEALYSATGDFVRCVMSDGGYNNCESVKDATAVITVELTRPIR